MTTALRDEVSQQLITNATVAAQAAAELKTALEQQDFQITHIDADVKESLVKVAANIEQVQALSDNFRQLYSTCEVSFQQNTAQATERVIEIQRQVQSLVDRTLQGNEGTHSGGSSGGQPRDRQIFDPREYKIESLSASPTLAAFKKWRADVEIYIDTIGPSWKGIKNVLQQVRHSSAVLVPTAASMLESVNRAKAISKGLVIDDVTMEWSEKAGALYKLLLPKLNIDLSTEYRNAASENGFELWRLINRKMDPPRADLDFHLINGIQRLARSNCVDFAQTVRFVNHLETRKLEFQTETGSVLDPEVLARVLSSAMDEDTHSRIEDTPGVDVKVYSEAKQWIESRDVKLKSRQAGKMVPKESDKMVYGVDQKMNFAGDYNTAAATAGCRGGCGGCAEHAVPTVSSSTTLPPADPSTDPWLQSPDPWTQGAAPAAPPVFGASSAIDGLDLDPFNKGKGKGKGAPRIEDQQCYNCDGWGHRAKGCGSGKGAKGQGGTPCTVCKGKRHRGNARVKAVEHSSRLFLGQAKGETKVVRTVGKAQAFLDGDRDHVAREFRESMMEVGQT